MSTRDEGHTRTGTDSAGISPGLGIIMRTAVMLAILAAGGGIATYWMANKPKAQRHRPPAQATLVQVTRVEPKKETVVVNAMGTVVAARHTDLAAQVSGPIKTVEPAFIPGGQFKADQRIVQIEPKDYDLIVAQRKSDLAKAQSALKEEMGRQAIARRGYELLGKDVTDEDKALVLREPQLAAAKADVAAAQAAYDKAVLDKKRTDVLAPFNAMVLERQVERGAQVSPGTVIASLVGTDEFWVEISVPVDELKWIRVPGFNDTAGSTVRIYNTAAWGPDVFRKGAVKGLMTSLEPEGRMARVLVSIADPLELESKSPVRRPLILGSYVRVEVVGRDLPDVVKVARSAVRDGNCVWVMTPKGTLDIRKIETEWSTSEHVCACEGLSAGDLLVTSDLAAPVQGMALRTAQNEDEEHDAATGADQP